MNKNLNDKSLWQGLRLAARKKLVARDYKNNALEELLKTSGAFASEVAGAEKKLQSTGGWIPGVRLFPRMVHSQLHRGFFSELGREAEGAFETLGFWPKQWATARMFAGTAKGFHVHPPHVPKGKSASAWNQRFLKSNPSISFAQEQWDIMFFIQGRCEFFLVDEREGLSRTTMRFFIGSDAADRANNFAVAIPPGVAHAVRVEGSEDAIMVYGTSVTFDPANEGRIASGIETVDIPPEWESYLRGSASR